MATLTSAEFISALHEEMDIVTDLVHTDLEDSNSFATAMIKDGGDIRDITQTDSIEYTAARPAYVGYNSRDHSPQPLVAGQLTAAGETGEYKDFDTNVNDRDPRACDDGFCTFKYAQGFKRYTSKDYDRPMQTDIFCVNDFLRMGDAHVDGFFKGLFESYRKYGVENFEAELQNRVIEFGGANGSITGGGLQLSSGGWHEVPKSRLTIHYLLEYRDYLEYEGALENDGLLTIEAPRQDWFDAVTEHNVRKNGMGNLTNFDLGMLDDPKAELYGRSFHIYENVRCIFNERPVRGYFKPDGLVNGKPVLSFTRIFPWVNKVNDIGGVSEEPNHSYNQPTINVDGITYQVCTLAFNIHSSSFERYRIMEARKPVGDGVLATNFSVKVLDGAWLPNNKKNTKFQLISNHAYRLKTMKVERSGAIAYLHSRPAEYIVPVTSTPAFTRPDATLFPQEFATCPPSTGAIDACEVVGGIPNQGGDCVDQAGVVFDLQPAGEVTTVSDGTDHTVRLTVRRTGTFASAATVDYHVTAEGSAVAGTHFVANNGVLAFEAGESVKTVDVTIKSGAGLNGTTDGVKVEINNPTGTTPIPTLDGAIATIIIKEA